MQSAGMFMLQVPEKRVVKLPEGQPVLFSEANPNPANGNSAVAISYQVQSSVHGQVAKIDPRKTRAQQCLRCGAMWMRYIKIEQHAWSNWPRWQCKHA